MLAMVQTINSNDWSTGEKGRHNDKIEIANTIPQNVQQDTKKLERQIEIYTCKKPEKTV